MQPKYIGTCNIAKSCTNYSQNICSVLITINNCHVFACDNHILSDIGKHNTVNGSNLPVNNCSVSPFLWIMYVFYESRPVLNMKIRL